MNWDLPQCDSETPRLLRAAADGNYEELKQRLKESEKQKHVHVQAADSRGRNLLHFLVTNSAAEAELQQMLKLLVSDKLKKAFSDMCGRADSLGRIPLFYACLLKQVCVLGVLVPHSPLGCADSEGNSVLHALFANCSSSRCRRWQPQQLVQAMVQLAEAGAEVQAENSMQRNCVQSCEMDAGQLAAIFAAACEETRARDLLLRLRCSLSKNHPQKLQQVTLQLVAICDIELLLSFAANQEQEEQQLLQARHQGASCLHFACDSGHRANIRWLLQRRLSLNDKMDNGSCCIDVACEAGTEQPMLLAARDAGVEAEQVLRQMDNATQWLQEPPAAVAAAPSFCIGDSADSTAALLLRAMQRDCPSSLRHLLSATDILQLPEQQLCDTAVGLQQLRERTMQLRLTEPSEQVRNGSSSSSISSIISISSISSSDSSKNKQNKNDRNNNSNNNNDSSNSNSSIPSSLPLLAVHFRCVTLLPLLLCSRQFDLIPSCLIVLSGLGDQLENNKDVQDRQKLRQQQQSTAAVLVNCLQLLQQEASKDELKLLFRFMEGDFDHENSEDKVFKDGSAEDEAIKKGPKFLDVDGEEKAAIDLVDTSDKPVFASTCLQQLVNRQWKRRSEIVWLPLFRSLVDPHVFLKARARFKFWLNFASVALLFVTCCVYFQVMSLMPAPEPDAATMPNPLKQFSFGKQHRAEAVVLACVIGSVVVGNLLKNFHSWRQLLLRMMRRPLRLVLWLLAALAVASIGAYGLALAIIDDGGSVVFDTLLLLLYFCWWFWFIAHFADILRHFRHTGPTVTMLRHLIQKDLMPFLLLLCAICIAFGAMFVSLLFPYGSVRPTTASTDLQQYDAGSFWVTSIMLMFTLPASLAFGFTDKIDFERGNFSSFSFGKSAHPIGYDIMYNFFIFVFFVLVNLVMMNLLIALFSLRAAKVSSQSTAIWAASNLRLVRYHQNLVIVPLSPVNLLLLIADVCLITPCCVISLKLLSACSKLPCCRKKKSSNVHPEGEGKYEGKDKKRKKWWHSSDSRDYPEDYLRFLAFQARVLRNRRHELLQQVEENQSDLDTVRAALLNLQQRQTKDLEERLRLLEQRLRR